MNKLIFGILFLSAMLLSCSEQVKQQEVSHENVENDINIEYKIMVQRATQTAIWAMPT